MEMENLVSTAVFQKGRHKIRYKIKRGYSVHTFIGLPHLLSFGFPILASLADHTIPEDLASVLSGAGPHARSNPQKNLD
jgi:hypothetical protein